MWRTDAASAFPRALVALQVYVPASREETLLRNKEPFKTKEVLICKTSLFFSHVTFGLGTPLK